MLTATGTAEPEVEPRASPTTALSLPQSAQLEGAVSLVRREQAAGQLARRVFVSHTGGDEGARNFAASILNPALRRAGLDTFIDATDLRGTASPWPPELVDAAANSALMVVVLSRTYVQRYWCMLELHLALHAHAHSANAPRVLPVFYDSVHDTLSTNIVDFWTKERSTLQPERAQWVDAQLWADNIKECKQLGALFRQGAGGSAQGTPSDKNRDEQLAVEVVTAALRIIPPVIDTGVTLVGVDAQMTEVLAQLAFNGGAWLWGPGGAGKTTLAKALYNQLVDNFLHRTIVSVQEGDQGATLAGHVKGALKQLGAAPQDNASLDLQVTALRKFILANKVLLVVDNVWTAEQVSALLPVTAGELQHKLESGSVIIVTSRQQRGHGAFAIRAAELEVPGLLDWKVRLLEDTAALDLLRTRAGLKGPPDGQGLLQLEAKMVSSCGGLPLALELVGGMLFHHKNLELWQGVYHDLLGGSLEDMMGKVLSASFARLTPEAQSMFLDLVSVLAGMPAAEAQAVWASQFGPTAVLRFKELVKGSLVSVDEEGHLVVHDVIRALGRGMLTDKKRKELYSSRLWVDGQQQWDMQAASPSTECVRNIQLGSTHIKEWPKLRILQQELPLASAAQIPPGLLWLEASGGGWFTGDWPRRVPNLVVLRLQTYLSTSLSESIGGLTGLHTLRLGQCEALTHLSESIGRLTRLHTLDLLGCKALTHLPEGIGGLTGLHTLDLSGCEALTHLPDSIVQLTGLHTLDLFECEVLSHLPDFIGRLTRLHTLDLSRCKTLTHLPDSVDQLMGLDTLNLARCKALTHLPDSIVQLTRLHTLDLFECTALTYLPDSIGRLTRLHTLDLSRCKALTHLPDSIDQLTGLHTLNLTRCKALTHLPDSIVQLTRLHTLDLFECTVLKYLPEGIGGLTGLHTLDLTRCWALTHLPDSIGQLTGLHTLDLVECESLPNLPDSIGGLTGLHSLGLSWCLGLTQLPDSINQLTGLYSLNLTGCNAVTHLPDSIDQLTGLHTLDLTGCWALRHLPDSIDQLTGLQILDVTGAA